jgi:ZIP family zinc transporter
MNAVVLSFAAFVSTLAGGLLTLRFRASLRYMLSFSAGVLLAVVCFDILPELFELAREKGVDATRGMIALAGGFLLFHVIERFLLLHAAREVEYAVHRHPSVGIFSALALAGHSFMDGVGIGLGFQVSTTVGIAVAIAVISHDFCDGLNTVSLMLMHGNNDLRSRTMLLVDALAPVLGAVSTLAVEVPAWVLVPYLGFFTGFLLYIAVTDILPEAHATDSAREFLGLLGTTLLGSAATFVAVGVAS